MTIDDTHDPKRRSWVASANGHPDFPIQNLPFGIVAPRAGEPRPAVAIGGHALDLKAALSAGLLSGDAATAVEAMGSETLNGFLALGSKPRRALRARLSELLQEGSGDGTTAEPLLLDLAASELRLPARIGDYTDFYAGIHHATNVGRQFRPDAPLMPNYKWVPIGYHGRASSIVPSGTAIRRPCGQIKGPDFAEPSFTASRRLDFELELGIWIGPGNDHGEPIPIAEAGEHIAGFCLLNDWSARDIQAWEYQPLGPFLAKSFASTISPWIVTPEALAPFRAVQGARPEGDPAPLPYLLDEADQRGGALAIGMEVSLLTPRMREAGLPPHRIARSDSRHMYWTAAQLLAHHASNGCNLRPGDLFGSGTISGEDLSSVGSLLEATLGGKQAIALPGGEERVFLQDGDEVIMAARAERDGAATIGFGECRGVVLAAR